MLQIVTNKLHTDGAAAEPRVAGDTIVVRFGQHGGVASMVRGRLVATGGAAAATMVIWQARRTARPEPAPGSRELAPGEDGRDLFERAVALGRDDPVAAAAAYQLVI